MDILLKKTTKNKKTEPQKPKRNLDNTEIRKHFGQRTVDIWEKDINTGEGNYMF